MLFHVLFLTILCFLIISCLCRYDVSCKMTETVQSSGAAAIPDVHDVADHEMQEERLDYPVSKNLQKKVVVHIILGKK